MKKKLVFLLLMSLVSLAFSQNDPIVDCTLDSFALDAFEETSATTLCAIYGQQTPDLSIGEGTSWPKATDFFAPNLVGKKINITGDFIIDKDFTFKNCTIRITPGKSIFNNYFSLNIDNSKLFACQLLWKGIILGPVSRVKCFNNTIIEDAEGAIQCKNAEFAFIDLVSTTFNRNRIGILVENQNPYGIYPQITAFLQNKFTCTSPLNGTSDEYSFAGIKSKNLNLITSQNARLNQFFDQHYGIYTEGSPTEIGGQFFVMNRIKQEGILLHEGILNIINSNFTNCRRNAIHVVRNQRTNIQNGMIIINDLVLKNSIHNGIIIDEFLPGSNTDIKTTLRCTLNWSRFYEKVTGIHLQGGLVGAGTNINVHNSIITIDNKGGIGINLPGVFPSSSFTLLQSNNFLIGLSNDSPFTRSDYPTGISSTDEKNNLNIISNHFTGVTAWQSGNQTVGISILNSMGMNNEITSNLFYGIRFVSSNPPVPIGSAGFYFRTGLIMEDAMNFAICENNNDNGADNGFVFNNSCLNMDLGYNQNYGSRIGHNISASGIIFPQTHRANKWYPKIDKGWMLIPFRYSNCDNISGVDQNRFTVHTNQSVWDVWRYTYFSEYHPDRISPDVQNEFFNADLGGSPGPGCAALALGNISLTDISIADGTFPDNQNYTSGIFDAKKYLLAKLLIDPSLMNNNATLQTFYNQNINSTVGKIAKANVLLNNSYILNTTTSNAIDTALMELNELSAEIYALDTLIEQSEDYDTSLISQRVDLSEQHSDIQNQLESYYQSARSSFNNGLDIVIDTVETIDPDSIFESNEKAFFEILLQSLRYQQGKITESQAEILKGISEQCPSTGGYAVKIARALLPNCYTDVTEFCNDTIAMPQGETTIIYVGEDPLRGYDKNQFGSLSNFQAVENSYLTPDFGKSISYDLYNLSGMRVMSGNKPMDIYKDDNVGVGIYILVFTDSSGKIKTTKLAKIR